jgi:hypothetical protein
MQSEPLQRFGTQSVPHGIPTETVGTIIRWRVEAIKQELK